MSLNQKFKPKPLYTYDNKYLTFVPVKLSSYIYAILIAAFVFSSLGFTGAIQLNQIIEKIPVIIRMNDEEFSEQALRNEIKHLNLKFEDIIVAQYKVETGNGTSKIFKENHNLFGMKISKMRPSTASGENFNHAYYKNWKESLLDYAFWQVQNARSITTEDEYFKLLEGMYAESDNYVARLKSTK